MFGVKFNGKGDELSKQPKLSKQVIDIWHSVLEPEQGIVRRFFVLVVVCILHGLPFLIPQSWMNVSRESAPKTEAVRVRITQNQSSPSTSEQQPMPSPKDAQVKPQRAEKAQRKILTSKELNTDTSAPSPQIEVAEQANQNEQPPTTSSNTQRPAEPQNDKPNTLPKDVISPLLPSGKDEFITRQRQLGEVIGAGAIAGDLEIPDVVSEKDPNQPITRTEYTFAGYFDSLSRRFVEAWGGTRTLPPESRFEGKIGEFIEYDIVINRDGSLRKIVNITAKREPYRDFAAVDDLVVGVFKTMFPFQPVPARIRNDPLVIRKRIQFVGFKYRLY